MDKHIKWSIFAAVAAFVFMCGSVGYLAIHVAAKVPNLTATVNALDAALVHINKPCKGSGNDKADNCGTLALAGQVMAKSGDTIVETQLQEQAIIKHVTPVIDSLATVAPHLTKTTDALTGTANAATGTLNATTTTVQAAKPVLDNTSVFISDLDGETKPVIGQANVLLMNANSFITSPALTGSVNNVQSITGSGALAMTDFQTKFHILLYPPPCHTFGCKLARAYPYVKGVAELGEATYWSSQLFQNNHP